MYDVDVLWTGKYYQNWENNPHCHSFFQMIAVLKGSGTIQIQEEAYAFEEQDVFFIPPQTEHAVLCQPGSAPPQLLDIKFRISDQELLGGVNQLPHRIRLNRFGLFQQYFEQILQESLQRAPYYYRCICYDFNLLLIMVLRDQLKLAPVENPAPVLYTSAAEYGGIHMAQLVKYINDNYASIISLSDLAAIAGSSKTTLIQAFKTAYGTTPIKYINTLRLAKAKELLIHTDSSVSDISELIGFQSLHYFSRYFKLHEGVSPVEYRRQHSRSHFFTYGSAPAEEENEKFDNLSKR